MPEQGFSQARVHAAKLVRLSPRSAPRRPRNRRRLLPLRHQPQLVQDWSDARDIDEPWVIFLGEQTLDFSDHPRIARANRKKPKAGLLKRLASGTDPH